MSSPLKSPPAMNSAQKGTMKGDPQGDPASESAPRAKVGDPLDELSGRAGRAATFGQSQQGHSRHSTVTQHEVSHKGSGLTEVIGDPTN